MAITTSGTTLTFNDSTTQTTAPVNTNANVNSVSAGTGISVNSTTGAVTVTNSGVTSVAAGTGISVSGSTGGVTISSSVNSSQLCKAWVYVTSQTTVSGSYNVSSVTYSGSIFTVNLTTAMQDTNYSVVTTNATSSGSQYITVEQNNLRTTSSFVLNTNTNQGISAVLFR